ENACGEDRHCGQQPFNPPDLDRLPIQQRGGREQKAGNGGGDQASRTQKKGYQGGTALSQSLTQRPKIKPGADTPVPRPSQFCVAIRTTNMTKAGAHNKIGAATLTDMVCAIGGSNFLPLGYGGLPELLPLFVIGRGLCHKRSSFAVKTRIPGAKHQSKLND